jgi:hypothetical protein
LSFTFRSCAFVRVFSRAWNTLATALLLAVRRGVKISTKVPQLLRQKGAPIFIQNTKISFLGIFFVLDVHHNYFFSNGPLSHQPQKYCQNLLAIPHDTNRQTTVCRHMRVTHSEFFQLFTLRLSAFMVVRMMNSGLPWLGSSHTY